MTTPPNPPPTPPSRGPSQLGTRPELNPAHVKWRVDSEPSEDGNAHKARFVPWLPQERLADMLDEWVGPENWTDTYEPDGRFIWCNITVMLPTGHQVTKTDVGDMGESLKNATTDAFKRCATRKWGVGREVRHVPTLWAPCRTYVRRKDNVLVGVANNETRPTLDRKLADLGFAGWNSEVEEGPDHDDPAVVSDGPQPANPPTPDFPTSDTPDLSWGPDEIAGWLGLHGRVVNPAKARKVDLLRMVSEVQADTDDETAA